MTKPPTRRLDSVLEEFEQGQITEPLRNRRRCNSCGEVVRTKGGDLMKHEGPCGRPCLGGGVPVGVKFHDLRCDAPGCAGRLAKGTKA